MAEDAAVLQAQLGKLLSRIQGAGEVEVILTLRTGTQYVYQTDVTQEERSGEDDPQSSVTRETVLAASGSGQQQAVVTQTIYPTYRGAVVILSLIHISCWQPERYRHSARSRNKMARFMRSHLFRVTVVCVFAYLDETQWKMVPKI